MAEAFAVKLQTPWLEPSGLEPPTEQQLTGGVVICMTATATGLTQSMVRREYWLVDPAQADGWIAGEVARHVTERERKCAAAVGEKWPKPGVKAAAPAEAKAKPKKKSKAKGAAAEGE